MKLPHPQILESGKVLPTGLVELVSLTLIFSFSLPSTIQYGSRTRGGQSDYAKNTKISGEAS